MRNILIFTSVVLLTSFFSSCSDNSQSKRIIELEDSLGYFKTKFLEKDSLYDSIYNEYSSLKEKMTKHIKYVYTVYDDVIRDEDGYEWDMSDFLWEIHSDYGYVSTDDIDDYIVDHYSKYDIMDLFDISAKDFEDEFVEIEEDIDYDTHGRVND